MTSAPAPAPPFSAGLAVGRAAVAMLGGLAGAWLAGWVVCVLMDMVSSHGNAGYAYVTWFLTGAIAAFVAMASGGEWAAPPGVGRRS